MLCTHMDRRCTGDEMGIPLDDIEINISLELLKLLFYCYLGYNLVPEDNYILQPKCY